MAFYGFVWLCRAIYGYVGLCKAMYGYVGLCMAMYGYVWLCKLKVKLGVFLAKFVRLGAVGDALVSLGKI